MFVHGGNGDPIGKGLRRGDVPTDDRVEGYTKAREKKPEGRFWLLGGFRVSWVPVRGGDGWRLRKPRP